MVPNPSTEGKSVERNGKKNGNGANGKPAEPVVQVVPKPPIEDTLFAVRRTAEGRVRVVFDADEVQAGSRSKIADCATAPAEKDEE